MGPCLKRGHCLNRNYSAMSVDIMGYGFLLPRGSGHQRYKQKLFCHWPWKQKWLHKALQILRLIAEVHTNSISFLRIVPPSCMSLPLLIGWHWGCDSWPVQKDQNLLNDHCCQHLHYKGPRDKTLQCTFTYQACFTWIKKVIVMMWWRIKCLFSLYWMYYRCKCDMSWAQRKGNTSI